MAEAQGPDDALGGLEILGSFLVVHFDEFVKVVPSKARVAQHRKPPKTTLKIGENPETAQLRRPITFFSTHQHPP